jgi:hypothetical protein
MQAVFTQMRRPRPTQGCRADDDDDDDTQTYNAARTETKTLKNCTQKYIH